MPRQPARRQAAPFRGAASGQRYSRTWPGRASRDRREPSPGPAPGSPRATARLAWPCGQARARAQERVHYRLFRRRAAGAVPASERRRLFGPVVSGAQARGGLLRNGGRLSLDRSAPGIRDAGMRRARLTSSCMTRPASGSLKGCSGTPASGCAKKAPPGKSGVQEQRRPGGQLIRLPGGLSGRPAGRVRPPCRHPDPVPGHQADSAVQARWCRHRAAPCTASAVAGTRERPLVRGHPVQAAYQYPRRAARRRRRGAAAARDRQRLHHERDDHAAQGGSYRPRAAHDRGGHRAAGPDPGPPGPGHRRGQPRHNRAQPGAASRRPADERARHPARVPGQGEGLHRPPRRGPGQRARPGMWERALDAIGTGNLDTIAREIDWVIKYQLIQQHRARYAMPLSAPEVAQVDLAYHDVQRGRARTTGWSAATRWTGPRATSTSSRRKPSRRSPAATGRRADPARSRRGGRMPLNDFPRYPLILWSPVHPLDRLSAHLGARSGQAGGLQLRARLRRQQGTQAGVPGTRRASAGCGHAGVDRRVQSNHTRQVAAVAARLGLGAVLVQENGVDWPIRQLPGRQHRASRTMGADVRLIEAEFGIASSPAGSRHWMMSAPPRDPVPHPAGASDHRLGGLGFANWAYKFSSRKAAWGSSSTPSWCAASPGRLRLG